MSRMRVALFEQACQAEAARERLERAGIKAVVQKQSTLARLWYVSGRATRVRLDVPSPDRERARRLLIEWNRERQWRSGAVCCPECGSLRIDYPQITEKSMLTNFAVGLLVEVGLVEREYYCEDCHCMWPPQRGPVQRNRSHLAPDYFLEDWKSGPEQGSARKRAGTEARGRERG